MHAAATHDGAGGRGGAVPGLAAQSTCGAVDEGPASTGVPVGAAHAAACASDSRTHATQCAVNTHVSSNHSRDDSHDVRGAVRDLLDAVAETRRRRSQFESSQGQSTHGLPLPRPNALCTDAPQGLRAEVNGQRASGTASVAAPVKSAREGAPLSHSCGGDGGLEAVQHPVVQSVLSQIVSSIAATKAAPVVPRTEGDDQSAGAADDLGGVARGGRGVGAANIQSGWRGRRGRDAEPTGQPPLGRSSAAMPRTANGWRGFLSVKDLRPPGGRVGGRGGRGATRTVAGAPSKRPEWNADVMPPSAVPGRGRRGVAPIGGWGDAQGQVRPSAQPGALSAGRGGRGPHARVALGKRDRDGTRRAGPGERGRGAGAQGRRRPRAQMDAAAWKAMTEGADDPLLDGEETGLSLALDTGNSDDAEEEDEQRRLAVEALEAELAEAAQKEVDDDGVGLSAASLRWERSECLQGGCNESRWPWEVKPIARWNDNCSGGIDAGILLTGATESSESPEAPSAGKQPEVQQGPQSPPPEAWRRLRELEDRVGMLTKQLQDSETADSPSPGRSPSRAARAAARPPADERHQGRRRQGVSAVPELAERLARIEVAEQQIYAKWFTAAGEPRGDGSCGGSSPASSTTSHSSDSSCGGTAQWRSDAGAADACTDDVGDAGGAPLCSASDDGREERCAASNGNAGEGSTVLHARARDLECARARATSPTQRSLDPTGGPSLEQRGLSRGSAPAAPVDMSRSVRNDCMAGRCGGPVADEDDGNVPQRILPVTELVDDGEGCLGTGQVRSDRVGRADCHGGDGADAGVGVLSADDVERLLQDRQRVRLRRAARNANIAAANGLGSASSVAAAVVTGAMNGLPVGYGGAGGCGPQPGEVDVVAMVEAAADQVVDEIVEEHVGEMLRVCDNAVDWIFAAEFAPLPDEA